MKKFFNALYYRLFKRYKSLYIKRFQKKPIRKEGKKASLEQELIVSFTTIPSRIAYLSDVIKSILNQTILPDRFILYIYKDEFTDVDIESILAEEIRQGLEIIWVDENLRSHKKYFYAMKDNPNAIVIVIDDDTIYPPTTIERLIESYKRFPEAISAMRCHKIKFSQNASLLPYNDWEFERMGGTNPSHLNFFTGCGGVLFPPKARTEELFNRENIKSLSFLADDVWLNLLAVKNGIKVAKATWGKGTPITIDDNPEESLVYINAMYDNNNDKCIANMVKYYQIDFTGVD